MEKFNIKPREQVALAVLLLVLVVTALAYYVFVPKLQEVAELERNLIAAKKQRQNLQMLEPLKEITQAEKVAISIRVPPTPDQARFLKDVRAQEAETGVQVKSIVFTDEETEKPSAASQEVTAPEAEGSIEPNTPMLRGVHGKISLEGEYVEIRQFIEKFSGMQRLVSFKKWEFSAVDIIQTNTSTMYRYQTEQGKSSSAEQMQKVENGTSASSKSPTVQQTIAPEYLNDELLNDRSPIFAENEFNRVAEMVRAKIPTFGTQKERDIANLQIQQAFNRYTAGLTGQQQAASVFDQDTAQVFIPDANPDIKKVLGISQTVGTNATAGQVLQDQPMSSQAAGPLPLMVLTPTEINKTNSLYKVIVKLDIDFVIYVADNAQDILPPAEPVQTYDPTERANPVEPS